MGSTPGRFPPSSSPSPGIALATESRLTPPPRGRTRTPSPVLTLPHPPHLSDNDATGGPGNDARPTAPASIAVSDVGTPRSRGASTTSDGGLCDRRERGLHGRLAPGEARTRLASGRRAQRVRPPCAARPRVEPPLLHPRAIQSPRRPGRIPHSKAPPCAPAPARLSGPGAAPGGTAQTSPSSPRASAPPAHRQPVPCARHGPARGMSRLWFANTTD